jgi:ABC-type dipeptide/oligopeptide/nickel transport system permease subunit
MSVSTTSDLELAEAEAGATVELVGGGEIAARSPWELFFKRFREDKFALVSIGFLILLILVAIFAPVVCSLVGAPGPYHADESALDIFGQPTGPSSAHLFGVDQIGRDVFSRVVYGARISLVVAFVSTAITTVIGVFCGLFAGYYRGWVDTLVSRTVDAWLAIPYLLFAIGLASACSFGNGCLGGLVKPGVPVVIAVIALTSWTYPARIIRGQVLSLREKEFVDASRSLGASDRRIIVKELLPNLTAPIIVFVTTFIPTAILFEAALSFLGVGVQPPTPSWGQMISDASPNVATQWWYMLFPGLALLFTVLAFNFVGDAMTDALNPRTRKS